MEMHEKNIPNYNIFDIIATPLRSTARVIHFQGNISTTEYASTLKFELFKTSKALKLTILEKYSIMQHIWHYGLRPPGGGGATACDMGQLDNTVKQARSVYFAVISNQRLGDSCRHVRSASSTRLQPFTSFMFISSYGSHCRLYSVKHIQIDSEYKHQFLIAFY